MKIKFQKWLLENTDSLKGKTVAITGSTGGLGGEICMYLAYLGASLILLDRNKKRSEEHRDSLLNIFPDASVRCVTVDLSDFDSVNEMLSKIEGAGIDILIHNAGAYSIPRETTSLGYDNVFQINFVSPYYITHRLIDTLKARGGRVVIVGSIAHNYSRTDRDDVDFSTRKKASLVYGNAKRYLMFSVESLCLEKGVDCAITHPGITFTNITSHYPKLIFALIKHPMKIIFMSPSRAALSVLRGVFLRTEENEWIGPRFFNIWGKPNKKKINTADADERIYISKIANAIYEKISNSEWRNNNEN